MSLFRFASHVRGEKQRPNILAIPVGVAYRLLVEWTLGVELPWRTTVGPGLRILHGQGLVVKDHAVIGEQVTLRHSVTIGSKYEGAASPVLGDGVDVGAGAIILGEISVGENSVIGAGAVVVSSVPPRCVAVGNPAKSRPLG